ncbi:MAG: ATP-binding cassette domain-containing protein [Verrucomicrobiales bacterium]
MKCARSILLPLTGGEIRLLGKDSRKLRAADFRDIGYVADGMALPLWMTVRRFIAYCRPLYPAWDRALEAQLLRDFALPEKTRLRSLSRGQRMKAALLCALAYRPKLVILDEPFSVSTRWRGTSLWGDC